MSTPLLCAPAARRGPARDRIVGAGAQGGISTVIGDGARGGAAPWQMGGESAEEGRGRGISLRSGHHVRWATGCMG